MQSGTVTIARLIPGEEIATDAGVPHFMYMYVLDEFIAHNNSNRQSFARNSCVNIYY